MPDINSPVVCNPYGFISCSSLKEMEKDANASNDVGYEYSDKSNTINKPNNGIDITKLSSEASVKYYLVTGSQDFKLVNESGKEILNPTVKDYENSKNQAKSSYEIKDEEQQKTLQKEQEKQERQNRINSDKNLIAESKSKIAEAEKQIASGDFVNPTFETVKVGQVINIKGNLYTTVSIGDTFGQFIGKDGKKPCLPCSGIINLDN